MTVSCCSHFRSFFPTYDPDNQQKDVPVGNCLYSEHLQRALKALQKYKIATIDEFLYVAVSRV